MDKLINLRNEIDKIDKEILTLFQKRMDIVKEVIEYKKEHNIPILNKGREKEVIEDKVKSLKNKDLEKEVVKFFTDLMAVSKEYQGRLLNK